MIVIVIDIIIVIVIGIVIGIPTITRISKGPVGILYQFISFPHQQPTQSIEHGCWRKTDL